MIIENEGPAAYHTMPDDWIIAQALAILQSRMNQGPAMESPEVVKKYLCVHSAQYDALGFEVFSVLFLDNRHKVIELREMFRGTTAQASIYPKEVAREALRLNASAVVLTHNHPSGATTPSKADELITTRLKEALALIDVRVLDHIITGHGNVTSMAELGLM